MMHKSRDYSAVAVETPAELAEKLTQYDWCGCNGFRLDFGGRDLFYLNDSTGPDGAQEYAVLQAIGGGQFEQVESITFSWCTQEKALAHIEALHRDDLTKYGRVSVKVQAPQDHGTCRLCA